VVAFGGTLTGFGLKATTSNGSATVPSAIPAGSTVIVTIGHGTETTAFTVTDSKGNTYTKVTNASVNVSAALAAQTFYSHITTALAANDLVTANGASNRIAITGIWITGADTTAAPEVQTFNNGSGTAATVSGTTTTTPQFLYAGLTLNNVSTTTMTPAAGWDATPPAGTTGGGATQNVGQRSLYQLDSSAAGVKTASATIGSSAWVMTFVSFEPPAGAGAEPITASDILAVAVGDTASNADVFITATDTLAVSLTETFEFAPVAVSASDTLGIVLDEQGDFGSTPIAASDDLAVGITDVGTVDVVQPPAFYSDFSGVANGQPWPAPWLTNLATGTTGGVIDVQSGQGRARGHTGTYARVQLDSQQQTTDGVIDAKVTIDAAAVGWVYFWFRASGGWNTNDRHTKMNGYRVSLAVNNSQLTFGKRNAGVNTDLATVPYTYAVGTYNVKIRFEGNAVSVKLWLLADPEPAGWTLTSTDPTSDWSSGEFSIGCATGTDTTIGRLWYFDDISLSGLGAAPEPITASDTLAVAVTDDVTGTLVAVIADDNLGVAVGGTVGAADVFLGASDDLAIAVTDAPTLDVSLDAADTVAVAVTDTVTSTDVEVTASDTLAVGITDVGTVLVDAVVEASDTLAVAVSDEGTVLVDAVVEASDTLAVGITEVVTADVFLDATDTAAVTVTESFEFAAVAVTATDTAAVAVDDVGVVGVDDALVAASDTLDVGITDTVVSVAVEVSASDTVAVGLTDTVTTVAVEVAASDVVALDIAESFTLAVEVTATDTTAIAVADEGSITADVSVTASDTLALGIDETFEFAPVVVSAADVAAVVLTETYEFATVEVSASDVVDTAITDVASAPVKVLPVPTGIQVAVDGVSFIVTGYTVVPV
jgi:hypothetical protein